MATAGERLVALRQRVRTFDERTHRARAAVVGEVVLQGELSVSEADVAKLSKQQQDDRDRKVLSAEAMQDDGWSLEKTESHEKVLWRPPRGWPGIPQRPPRQDLGGGVASGTLSGGGGGSSGSGSGPRALAQQREDAREWENYLKALSDQEEWRRRQAMRAWLIGSDILEQVLASPKLVRVVRKSGVKHAAQLFDEDLLKGQGLVPPGEPGA